ncbi:hypothetical protein EDC01DRAFT_727405 [Geopyxis carbonaria]|nr:hypothetical protein EDC01DRAFT_727405 [Geopyxis carbonaria]
MAPHAEPEVVASSTPQTNGNTAPSSPTYKSFDHLKSYPVVADGITTFSSHPLGQRTISLSHSAYSTFIAPLSPYLSKAYPYVNKADEFANDNLVKIETRFPLVKEPTESLKTMAMDTLGYPRKLAGEVIVRGQDFAKGKKEYVFKVYDDEFSKMPEAERNSGYIPIAKAGVTTGFVVSSELMGAIAGYLGNKKEQAQTKAAETTPEKIEKN